MASAEYAPEFSIWSVCFDEGNLVPDHVTRHCAQEQYHAARFYNEFQAPSVAVFADPLARSAHHCFSDGPPERVSL